MGNAGRRESLMGSITMLLNLYREKREICSLYINKQNKKIFFKRQSHREEDTERSPPSTGSLLK